MLMSCILCGWLGAPCAPCAVLYGITLRAVIARQTALRGKARPPATTSRCPAAPAPHSPSLNVPLRDASLHALFSGTATPVLLLLVVVEAPALRERESLVYHWRYWMHLQYNQDGILRYNVSLWSVHGAVPLEILDAPAYSLGGTQSAHEVVHMICVVQYGLVTDTASCVWKVLAMVC